MRSLPHNIQWDQTFLQLELSNNQVSLSANLWADQTLSKNLEETSPSPLAALHLSMTLWGAGVNSSIEVYWRLQGHAFPQQKYDIFNALPVALKLGSRRGGRDQPEDKQKV